ncbi:GntP family permease [Candidatus Bathyarchaeota archaeon]|nr:GntP family permease [Candidatus Bathyarchaeota archaeon]
MVEGWALIGIFILGLVGIIFLTTRLRVHTFLTMFFMALLIGIVAGISPLKMVDLVILGFSSVLGYIAIIVISATIIGEFLDKTGATLSISNSFLKLFGKNRSPVAMAVAGYLVSIPLMCCDTAFIVLSPLARALSIGSSFSITLFSLVLAAGAFTGFKLIFPAAPLFPTVIFGADVVKVMLLGFFASIPALAAGIFLSYRWSREVKFIAKKAIVEDLDEKEFRELPSLWAALSTLFVPIALIILRSLLEKILDTGNSIRESFNLIGHPVIAMPLGIILALMMAKGRSIDEINGWVSKGIQRASHIIVIVGAGGVLGKILQETGIGIFLGNSILGFGIPSILAVFLISALIKTSQGSSMVTMVTAPAILLPLLPTLNISPTLAAMAVSAGAMICVNVNDSFFWVTTGFAGFDTSTGYKTITFMSIIMGLVSLTVIYTVSILIGI